jgi:hypothetical protein
MYLFLGLPNSPTEILCRLRLKCDGTRAETRFRLSAKRTSPFKSAGASAQANNGSRAVRISGNNAGYTMFRGSVKGTGYHSIRHCPLHLPSRAWPYAITFQLDSTFLPSHPSHIVRTICKRLNVAACKVLLVSTVKGKVHARTRPTRPRGVVQVYR